MPRTSPRPTPRALPLALALLCLAAAPAFAKAPRSTPKTNQPGAGEAIPAATAAGVKKVFGPAYYVWANPAIKPVAGVSKGAMEKSIKVKVGNTTKPFKVQMAYEDLEIAKAARRAFLNADPFKLPNGIYTWAIMTDGTTSYGMPVDSTELGTRHMQLCQGKGVVASGELSKSNAGLRLNYSSGTYMIPTFGAQRDPEKLVAPITTWFDKVLRKKFNGAASTKVTFHLNGKPTKDNDWGADSIFSMQKNGGDRLPAPTFCELKTKIKACDAKYVFAKLNVDFCKQVNAFKCN